MDSKKIDPPIFFRLAEILEDVCPVGLAKAADCLLEFLRVMTPADRRAWILKQENPRILVQLCAHHQVCSRLNRT